MTARNTPAPVFLMAHDEPFAAGFFEQPEASPFRRWSRAVRRRFEHRGLAPYRGQRLFPVGPAHREGENRFLKPSYSFTWQLNRAALQAHCAECPPGDAARWRAFAECMDAWESSICRDFGVHTLGGGGYTHSIPNYGRVLREGLDSHAQRIQHGLSAAREAGDTDAVDFYVGLQDVLAGVAAWHRAVAKHLSQAPCETEEARARRDRLVAAYQRVPFQPARSFFEAMVAYGFVYYADDCDNPGRVDQELIDYYDLDLSSGALTRAEAFELVRALWRNVDDNNGWSVGLGGTSPSDGGPGCNAMTLVCLEAAQGMRRPNLQLHVRRDMPEAVWDAALDCLATGCGLPSLYNEEAFLDALRAWDLGVAEEDLAWHNGGGCTETMIHGRSNVGSLDAGLNLLLTLEGTLQRHLAHADTFDALLSAFEQDVARDVRAIAEAVCANQRTKARFQPQPVRSLLIDDCLDAARDFNSGGARYNWSVINVGGLANVADALSAVRQVVFETRERTGAELLDVLAINFEGCELFRRQLERCPRYGNDDPAADNLARDVAATVFGAFARHTPWRGGRFLPSCIMFTTYGRAGASVGATPDGRKAGTPVADSAGPVQGRDRRGPTAMIRSVTRLPHRMAPGTLVVNARFAKRTLTVPEERAKLRQLIRTYFDLGGMQIQINVVDQAVLREAVDHPEQHQDLIVRIGGFSEYFTRLGPDLQQSLLARTEHGL